MFCYVNELRELYNVYLSCNYVNSTKIIIRTLFHLMPINNKSKQNKSTEFNIFHNNLYQNSLFYIKNISCFVQVPDNILLPAAVYEYY